MHLFRWWGSLTHDFEIVTDAVAVSRSNSNARTRNRTTTKVRTFECGSDPYQTKDTHALTLTPEALFTSLGYNKKWLRLFGSRIARCVHCVVLIHDTGVGRLLPMLLTSIASGPHQTKRVSDFPALHFLLKYLFTDDALNYPKPFFIRAQCSSQIPSFHPSHSSAGIFGLVYFAQFYSHPKCVRICFLWSTGFVSTRVNIVETFVYRSCSIRCDVVICTCFLLVRSLLVWQSSEIGFILVQHFRSRSLPLLFELWIFASIKWRTFRGHLFEHLCFPPFSARLAIDTA